MRHRVYGKYLGRNKDERDRLFKGLVSELFLHGNIKTSQAKAKAIKGLVDRVINLAKEKRTQPKLQSFLTDKNLTERLIKEIVPKIGNRTSGYTSLIRLGTRLGDQTTMVKMSLIGAEELKPIEKGLGSRVQGTVKKAEPVKQKKATTGRSVSRNKSTRRATSRTSKIKK